MKSQRSSVSKSKTQITDDLFRF